MSLFRRFLHDTRGTTAIEYAVIGAILAVAVLAAVSVFASGLSDLFGSLFTAMDGALN